MCQLRSQVIVNEQIKLNMFCHDKHLYEHGEPGGDDSEHSKR